MTDSRDGKIYKTVVIGSQTWMAENLNYTDSVKTPSLKGNSWCYDNDSAKCVKYGRLYTWTVAIDSICPTNWHLPSRAEWETLFTSVGGQSSAGKNLKSQSGWNGTDAFGFSALPGSGMSYIGFFLIEGSDANFWSSSYADSNKAYYMWLSSGFDDADLRYDSRYYGFSVRCIKG